MKIENIPLLCLRIGTCLCFAGWAWVHLYWQAPYGILIWNSENYEFLQQLGISWDTLVGTGAGDGLVQVWMARLGWLYVLFAIVSLTIRKGAYLQIAVLVLGSLMLYILFFAKYLAVERQLPMLVEHGGQILIPLILICALQFGIKHQSTIILAILAVITTFAGHGCYALGLWPTPGNYYAMTTLILNADFQTVRTFLHIAGILDFILCIAILHPFTRIPAIAYAAFWGFVTALARPVSGMSLSLNYWGADQFLHEAILRAPHFLIPLFLWIIWHQQSKALKKAKGSKHFTNNTFPTPAFPVANS